MDTSMVPQPKLDTRQTDAPSLPQADQQATNNLEHEQQTMDSHLHVDDSFESPAFIVQSPTATMTQADSQHPFYNFPLLANVSRVHAQITKNEEQEVPLQGQQHQQNTENGGSWKGNNENGTSLDMRLLSFTSTHSGVVGNSFTATNQSNSSVGESFSQNHDENRQQRYQQQQQQPDEDKKSSSKEYGRNLSVEDTTPKISSRRSSMQFSTQPIEVKETLDARVTETADGHLQLKQYVLKEIIGQGAYGIVNLGLDVETGVSYAIKEFSKSKLRRKKDRANLFKLGRGRGRGPLNTATSKNKESSSLELIRGEIAVLKKLNHINIVKLFEVLDVATEDSMFMVMELCERGVLTDVTLGDKVGRIFSDEECRDVFQQMVLGIEYLHEHDIIHRDIKPDNLLRSADGTLKIVDFGVSEMFTKKGNDMTTKSAGSPAFMAPELCRPLHGEVSGRATDVWSMGVTLYCIRYGRLPFRSTSSLELQRVIREDEADLSQEKDSRFKDVMEHLLEKDPAKRITIDELRMDPWLTDDGRQPLVCKEDNTENAVTEVTEDDLDGAIQRINGLVTVFKAISKFKRLIRPHGVGSRSTSGDSEVSGSTGAENGGDSPSISSSSAVLSSPPSMSLRFQGGRKMSKDFSKPSPTPSAASSSHDGHDASSDLLSKVEQLGLEQGQEGGQKKENEQRPAIAIASSNTAATATTPSSRGHSSEVSVHKEVDPNIAEEGVKQKKEEEEKEQEAQRQGVDEEKELYPICDFERGICYYPTTSAVKSP